MLTNNNQTITELSPLKSRFLALYLSAAVFLSISTNLRPDGYPVGVGEVSLLLLMLGSIFLKPWEQLKSPEFLFWVAVWGFTGLGFMFGNEVGNLRAHNAVAYLYTGSLTLSFLTVFSKLGFADQRRILMYFTVMSVAALWLGFFAYIYLDQSMLRYLGIDVVNNRYQGWCQNANQMSLLLVPAPFLVQYLWTTSEKRGIQNVGWAGLLLMTVIMGLIVRSDALGFSWLLGLMLFVAAVLSKRIQVSRATLLILPLIFFIGFLSVRVAAQQGLLGQPGQRVLYERETVLEKMRVGHGETDQKVGIRLQLWQNALQVWEKSPVFGHGPGAYSSFDMTESQSYAGMEAHNTIIDLMVQGGLLLGLAYVGLFGWLMVVLWRAKQWLLMISALMLFAFEFFMFHLRQPVLWFYLTLIVALARERASCYGR